MLKFLDIVLFSTHILVILFNLTGWIARKTRRVHLIVLSLTLFSWLILGIYKGYGYCFLTDWEWGIKRKLGETDLPASFIHYLSNNVLDFNIRNDLLDYITLILFVFIILITIWVNFLKPRYSNWHIILKFNCK